MAARTDRRSSSRSADIGDSHKLVIRHLSRILLMGFTHHPTGTDARAPRRRFPLDVLPEGLHILLLCHEKIGRLGFYW